MKKRKNALLSKAAAEVVSTELNAEHQQLQHQEDYAARQTRRKRHKAMGIDIDGTNSGIFLKKRECSA